MNEIVLNKKLVIWGRGARGKALYQVLGEDNVKAFIDENLQNDQQNSCPTISFDYYLASDYKDFPIIVSALYYEADIINSLKKNGIEFYFILSDEVSELQGDGIKDFLNYIPFPKAKDEEYVVIGSNLYSCICVEWLKNNGYNYVFLYSEDKVRSFYIKKNFGYDFVDSLIGVKEKNCIVATRESFLKRINFKNMIDIFDLSDYIPDYYNSSLIKYKNIHNGERCFLIGNGPSLSMKDIDKLRSVITFAANRIYKISNEWRPDYYICHDKKVIEDINVLEYNAKTKFFPERVVASKECVFEWFHSTHIYTDNAAFQIPFSEDISRKIYSGGNVIYIAMQIAAYMGFSEIYLLGVDCEYPKNKPSHFYGDEFDAGGDPQWNISIHTFNSAKKYADSHGIKIYNATRGGALEVFERVDFDSLDFLN